MHTKARDTKREGIFIENHIKYFNLTQDWLKLGEKMMN